MRNTVFFGLAVLALVLTAAVYLTQAPAQQTPAATTVIFIEDLDCPSCAKRVEKEITALGGVATVKTDVEKETATVTPEPDKTLSPRALWEAVEKAGFKPRKLEGPNGKYTEKPKV